MAIEQIAAVVLVLATLVAIYIAVLFSIVWIIKHIFNWLFAKLWFANFVLQTKERTRIWYKKTIPGFTNLWEFVSEIVIDPLFYGYALVAVVSRLQSISQYLKQYPQYNYFQILERDMNADTNFYMIFLLILTFWMLSKAWKHNQDVRRHKDMMNSLKRIEQGIAGTEKLDIGLINKEIREELKRIRDSKDKR